ncbi:MAG: hypothetical protein JW705_07270 [Methanosarcinaceae archaeon]|nr:hypothetical protein [Methanosarcinaceae archaeon]
MEPRWKKGLAGLEEAYPVRRQVFIIEQNVPEEIEIDKYDCIAEHLIVYHGDMPAATGRMKDVS